MKKLLPLILITIASLSASSQTLKPVIKDSLLCFTVGQSKEIAKRISLLESCEEQAKEYQNEISILDSIVLNKNKQVAILKSEIFNQKEIYKTSGEVNQNLQIDLGKCKASNRRTKLIAQISTACLIITYGLLVIK